MTTIKKSIQDISPDQSNLEPDSIDIDKESYDSTKVEEDIEYSSEWLERKSFRLALISIFSALSMVLGFALAEIPNIELFTSMIFLSGFVLGKKDGLIVGLLSSAIFVFFNPLGNSLLISPPLFIYQLFHYSMLGLIGGFTRKFLENKDYFKPKEDLYVFRVMLILGILGGVITFIYDILSTLFGGLTVSLIYESFLVTYLTGLIFTIPHLINNILAFIFILPGLIQIVYKILF
ncbi:MAG: ECF transporter S component [Promethearchaeota archaeon]